MLDNFEPADARRTAGRLSQPDEDRQVGAVEPVHRRQRAERSSQHDPGRSLPRFQIHRAANAVRQRRHWDDRVIHDEKVHDHASQDQPHDNALVTRPSEQDAVISDALHELCFFQHQGQDQRADHHPWHIIQPG